MSTRRVGDSVTPSGTLTSATRDVLYIVRPDDGRYRRSHAMISPTGLSDEVDRIRREQEMRAAAQRQGEVRAWRMLDDAVGEFVSRAQVRGLKPQGFFRKKWEVRGFARAGSMTIYTDGTWRAFEVVVDYDDHRASSDVADRCSGYGPEDWARGIVRTMATMLANP